MDMRKLYSDLILDHNKDPRNYGVLKEFQLSSIGRNPLCGDEINIFINLKDNKIHEISFTSIGCALSRASSSLMTSFVKNKDKELVIHLFNQFRDFLSFDKKIDKIEDLEKLIIFENAKAFPSRIKCILISWYTLKSALSLEKEAKMEF